MSEKKFCPECGYAMDINAKTCPECGCDMTEPAQEPVKEPAVAPAAEPAKVEAPNGSVIGAGARANVTGGVHTNTNTNTQVNTNTNTNTNTINKTQNVLQNQRTTNANIQTSNVDNSSVVNNTTIVMDGGKKEPEFCEVCGVPFDGKHARCPKCGKMICFDCKVKGKNRCVECEKKAVNDYRLAFQQLLLTTGGNLGTAGRQMMNQKARELEVEDVKAAIEKELMEEYKPTVKAEQPTVAASAPQAAQQAPATKAAEQSKGGVVDNREPLRPKSSKRGGGAKWFILLLLLAGVGGYFALSGGDKSEVVEPVATEQPVAAPKATTGDRQQPSSAAAPATAPTAAPVVKPAAKPVQPVQKAQPATPKTDADYEAGMAAYKAGEGLEAIKKFNASGSAQANYMLGVIYEKGCGNVAANAMMARKYYKKAAQQGSEEAKAKL